MKKYYTVHAYRFGDRERHSYPVGLYSKANKALKAADLEEEFRGGKYKCEVIEWIPDGENKDGSGMPYQAIRPLPTEPFFTQPPKN